MGIIGDATERLGLERRERAAGRDDRPDATTPVSAWTADLAVLAVLLVLMAMFGRPFSKLSVPGTPIYVTEIAIVLILAAALWRHGLSGAVQRIQRAIPVVLLSIFFLAGAIAATRGLLDFGFSRTLRDVGLVEYAVFIPIVALVVDTAEKARLLVKVLLVAGASATVVFSLVYFVAPRSAIGLIENPVSAVGIYLSLLALLVVAKIVHRERPRGVELAAAAVALVLMLLTVARSVTLALVASLAIVAVLAPRGLRLRAAAIAIAALAVSVGGALGVQAADVRSDGDPANPATPTVDPDLVLDDAGSGMAGGEVVAGDAAAGTQSREVRRGQRLEIPILGGLVPGRPYTVVFSVKPLDPVSTAGLVGNDAGTGWGIERWRAAPVTRWQRFQKTLTATGSAERFVLAADTGAARVRFDAVSIVEGRLRGPSGDWEERAQGETQAQPPRPAPRGDDAPSPGPSGEEPATDADKAGGVQKLGPPPMPKPPPPLVVAAEETIEGSRTTGEGANLRWRLAYWWFLARETAAQPVLGVGFGRPSAFRWNGVLYDARRDPADPNDATGPHNSFLNILYRTGLLGFLALAALVAIGMWRTVSALRRGEGGTAVGRSTLVGLVALFAFAAVIASFNVALEGPYMGIFFWTLVGLLLVVPTLARDDARQQSR